MKRWCRHTTRMLEVSSHVSFNGHILPHRRRHKPTMRRYIELSWKRHTKVTSRLSGAAHRCFSRTRGTHSMYEWWHRWSNASPMSYDAKDWRETLRASVLRSKTALACATYR